MADTGLILITPLMPEALSKATSIAAGQVSFAPVLQKQLADLAQSLTEIQDVAQGAEQRQESDAAIRLWLQKLNDAVYDAVDLLDKCDYGILVLQKEVQTSIQRLKQVHAFFSMAKKFEMINESLAEIRMLVPLIYLVIQLGERNSATAWPYDEMVHLLDSSEVVGREDDVSKIVYLLDDQKTQHPISGISILGMPGVGKTTVARSVYMKAKEEKLYDVVAWVCVSEDFNHQRILGEMLEYFHLPQNKNYTTDALLRDLGCQLENKTFLLILDDVRERDPNKWNVFASSFSKIVKTNGNSIVLTTRCESAASVLEKQFPICRYDLQSLSDDKCLEIIEKLVLRSSANALISSKQLVAKQCGGLPLVASAIGGFEIRKDNLIQLWMAGGFLQQISYESPMPMEDIGNEYFNELVSNSLFQDVRRDACGNVEFCKMHDVLHDLAVAVSKGETLIWENGSNIDDTSNIRNLRIKYDGGVHPSIPRGISQSLHSLFLEGEFTINMESDPKGLQSLKLVRAKTEVLLTSLRKLKRLKYLEIAESKIETLPVSFSELYLLQTLKVMQCSHLQKLPDDTSQLVSLRHLYVDDKKLLPKQIGRLTSLQTLPSFFVGTGEGFTIEELGGLSQLRGKLEIHNLEHVASKSEAIRARLNEKTELYDLKFVWENGRGATNINDEEVLECLQPHSNLKSLRISNFMGKNFPSWMNGVEDSNASSLLDNLVRLELSSCSECMCIPSLGLLPSLQVLYICGMSMVRSISHEWLGRLTNLKELRMGPFWSNLEEFPGLSSIHYLHASLESLSLEGWDKLKSLPDELRHLTALKKLNISRFGSLEDLPKWLGNLHSLQELKIELCYQLKGQPTLQDMRLRGLYNLNSFDIVSEEKCKEGRTPRQPRSESTQRRTQDLRAPTSLGSAIESTDQEKVHSLGLMPSPSSATESTDQGDMQHSSSSNWLSSGTSLSSLRVSLSENPHIYDITEISAATDNFLAKHYSSSASTACWRCNLRGRNTIVFRRKFRRKIETNQLRERLSVICRSHHGSIIRLLGASPFGHHICLVYEFIEGANLADCLRNSRNPNFTVLSTWMSRMQIATDLAHGLDYIHNKTGLKISIVHNHIKSSSIIVTEPSFNAKICHFGTSQLCGETDENEIGKGKKAEAREIVEVDERSEDKLTRSYSGKMQFAGGRGYMSPEFQASGVATQKSDVYAFGVVILELLSGEEPFKYRFDERSGEFIRTSGFSFVISHLT
ncbi:hypothetical protein SLEP1_g53819 [Rubroshorea leprosula]|uniref:Protein kinase domain-containing protein n=1 Tax=Rubroshorea leprosula TaxID=152421 RepID=A0AAV5MBI2_9ROSI|nr:hypothetical protein SLEP1_g53819 [Rubroshorea leprosula]